MYERQQSRETTMDRGWPALVKGQAGVRVVDGCGPDQQQADTHLTLTPPRMPIMACWDGCGGANMQDSLSGMIWNGETGLGI